jgi:hypothetical protein
MSEEQFLNLSREQQVKMLTTFRIKDTFWLIPMSILNGFNEDIETSLMPTNCNIDSNALPNNTPDSLCGSEVEVDGGTPLILFKKNLMIL